MKSVIIICLVLSFGIIKAQEGFLNIPALIIDGVKKSAPGICQSQFEGIDQTTQLLLIDATGKPSGIADGKFYHLGSYDECYNIKTDNTTENIGTVYGKYCLTTIPFSKLLPASFRSSVSFSDFHHALIDPRILGTSPDSTGLHIGICIPDGCSAEELSSLTDGFLAFDEDFCYSQTKAKELTPGAEATIYILAVFLAILVISTVYDLFCYYTNSKFTGIPHEALVVFSAFSNGKKLISSTSNPEQLLCLNGLRAISMMWVLLGHVYMNATTGPIDNSLYILEFANDAANMFILGASVAVDTFFALGGLVTVYAFLRAADKGVKFNVILYYLHRYIRLTPSLAILILIHATLIPFLGSGPTWNVIDGMLSKDCRDYWWSGLLYVQNYWHGPGTCVPQAWYLSVDFQLFLLSPLILIPLKKWPNPTLFFLGLLSISGVIIPMIITYYYKIPAWFSNMTDTSGASASAFDVMWKYYKQTYARFGPYVIGMLFGYSIYKMTITKMKLTSFESFYLLAFSLLGLTACVYAPYQAATATEYEFWPNALGNGLLRCAWAVCICILVVACVAGNGGPVDWFLSLPMFQFLTKLSYAMYLVHYAVICIRYGSSKIVYKFSNLTMMWNFWGDFALVLLLSVLLCLTFESPMIIIEKHLFGGLGKRTVKKVETSKKVVIDVENA